MKLNLIVMAVIASVSMLASAQTTTKSREEIKAEAVEALKAHAIKTGDWSAFPVEKGNFYGQSRAEIKAAAMAAAKAHAIKTGDWSAFPEGEQGKSTLPREAVKKEAKAALKSGAVKAGEK